MQEPGEGESRPHGVDLFPWPPPPRTIVRSEGRRRGNSPVTMLGILGVVVAVVLGVALLGRDNPFDGQTAIAGHPVAATTLPAAGAPRPAEPGTTGTTGTPKAKAVYELGTNPL